MLFAHLDWQGFLPVGPTPFRMWT